MADEQMSLQQFGATIKAKYPAYASRSDEEVGQAMLKKYPQYASRVKTSSSTPPKPFGERLTEIQPHQAVHSASDLGREVVRGVGNVGAGGLSVLLHPVKTAEGIGGFLKDPFTPGHPAATQLVESLSTQPLETLEGMAGQAAVFGGAGEAAKGVGGKVGQILTKTGPKETAELAKDTQAANEVAKTKAEKANTEAAEQHAKDVAKIEGKRKVDLRKHFEKTTEATKANEEAQGKVSRKEAVTHGVERLDTEVRGDLEKLEKDVNTKANGMYSDLKKVLAKEKAPTFQRVNAEGQPIGEPVALIEHLDDVAHAPLRGTETETPIIKSIGKRIQNGEVDLTYNDLQGYREELGRELRKGTLPPDVFTAYKGMMSVIDDAMGKIAESKGLKAAQDAARAYWRQYAETFIDRTAPARKALDSAERGGVGKSFRGMDQSGIEQIAKFDPKVAQRLNTLRGYQSEAAALPSKPGKLTSLPKLEPKPALPEAPKLVTPEVKTISPADMQAKKLTSLQQKGIPRVRKVGQQVASKGAGLYALWNVAHGNIAGAAYDAALGVGGLAATEGFVKLLQNPTIQRILTNPTEADIAQIPPEMRADMGPILDAARQRGIKVSPLLYAASGVPQPRRVGGILKPQ
jgi:hypothetical protein